MQWLGLPAALVGLGALAIGALLLALHLLRVRLRRVPVDTLLFFRAAGAVQRPRTLLGPPRRLLAWLLAFATAAACWLAFADPRSAGTAPSRIVIVAPDGTTDAGGLALLNAALEFADHAGLGPNGGVWLAATPPQNLRTADEPSWRAQLRTKDLVRSGAGAALPATLQLAADRLGPRGDGEIVVFGGIGPLPASAGGHAIVRRAPPGAPAAGFACVVVEETEPRALRVEPIGAADGDELVVRPASGEASLVRVPAAASVRIPGIATGQHQLTVALMRGDEVRAEIELPVPAQRTAAVALGTGIPDPVRLAVEADPLLEADPQAALQVTLDPTVDGPALVLEAGVGAAPRSVAVSARCPLPLAFADLRRAEASALAVRAEQQVWIEDRLSGAPLVALERARSGAPRLHVVAWLLEDAHRRDVPRLLAGGLRHLAGVGAPAVLMARVPVPLRLATPIVEHAPAGPVTWLAAPAPVNLQPELPGALALTDAFGHPLEASVVAVDAPLVVTAPAAPAASRAGPVRWLVPLLLLALCGLLVDLYLHHRGRLP